MALDIILISVLSIAAVMLISFIGFFVVSYCSDNNAIALPNPPLSNYLDYSSDEPLLNPYIET